ncbi:phage tail assembly chaperone G [Priestia aryabhattai]|uniref:phage tail assembly chaperone G n=1 Tax=Priestia aryabhattai TaxID=412384 RepID=UPI0023AEE630|nr:hypothetical protein [Priestia aryabhattai]MDE8676452.1 hypothetical protein [Priestia aryabhattai]
MKVNLYFANENSTSEKDLYIQKEFHAPFIPLLVVKEFTKLQAESENQLALFTPEELEKIIDLICLTFRRQFTVDDFYLGMPNDKFSEFITEFYNKVFNIQSNSEENTGKK